MAPGLFRGMARGAVLVREHVELEALGSQDSLEPYNPKTHGAVLPCWERPGCRDPEFPRMHRDWVLGCSYELAPEGNTEW